MRKFLSILLIAISISCAEDRILSGDLKDYLPEDSAVILQMQNPDLFFSNLQNNEFLKQNLEHPLSQQLRNEISVLDYFPHNKEALLAMVVGSDENIEFSFISRGRLEPKSLDSIKNKQIETLTSKDLEIKKYELEGKIAFSTHIDSITIISSSQQLLENSISGSYVLPSDLQTVFKAASAKKASIFINHRKASPLFGQLFPEIFPDFSNWTVVDAEIFQSQLKFDGITATQDSLPHLLNAFKGAGVAPNNLASITPVNSSEFTSITFQDFDRLHKNLNRFRKNKNEELLNEISILQNASEAGVIQLAEDKIFAVHTLDAEAARLSFEPELQQVEEYRNFTIFEYPGSTGFHVIISPLLNPEALQYVAFMDNWAIFANTTEAIKEVIAAVQNDLVLANTEAFQNAAQNLSSDASILMVRNNLAEGVTPAGGLNYDEFPVTAVQFIYQENFAHVHSVLAKSNPIKTSKPTAQAAGVDLAAALAIRPVFFSNHRTKGMDVAVQDVENTLYLISPEGKIHWKKNLGSRILGEVQTVDILRNGRYQLAFATQNELHVIDRDGNPVKPFPLKFRDDITQPLSIFDYDNNRDYRFVIVQGKELFMYDRKGKGVRGFTFSRAGSNIVQPPKHVRIARKDYILVPESSGKLNILSRTGKIRVPLKENFDFSENEWYEYNGNFVSGNTSGEIIKVSEQGSIKREDLDLAQSTRITATENTLVMLSENELTIKGNTVTLDFGLYSKPQIFFLNNKIYVSVTDLQAQKAYLFDSNAQLLPGFPVYGSSLIDLSNADGDSALELVVQGEENEILVYEVN